MSDTKLGHGPLSSWSSRGVLCFAIIYLRLKCDGDLETQTPPNCDKKTLTSSQSVDGDATSYSYPSGNAWQKVKVFL
jgi:hypothetical protein